MEFIPNNHQKFLGEQSLRIIILFRLNFDIKIQAAVIVSPEKYHWYYQ